jgi:hypothetical protein
MTQISKINKNYGSLKTMRIHGNFFIVAFFLFGLGRIGMRHSPLQILSQITINSIPILDPLQKN